MIIHFWERFPKIYDYIQILATGGFLKRVSRELAFLQNKKILDLGCGTGTLIEYIRLRDYLGVDVNKNFIKLARKKYPQFKFKVLDIVNKKIEENFDYILIMNVLHHLTDKQAKNLFAKINKKKFKEFVIIESNPNNLIGQMLGKFDAGSNFRKYDYLKKMIKEDFQITNTKVVLAPLGTYQYLLARCIKRKK